MELLARVASIAAVLVPVLLLLFMLITRPSKAEVLV